MRLSRLAAAAVPLLLLAACSGGGSTASRSSLDIGVDLPLSGPEARAATPVLDGFRFYFSRHPTVDGFAVMLTPLDDARGKVADPEVGLGNVQRFIADPRLMAMLGPFDSAVARKEIPAANDAGIAMVTPVTSSPCLTRDVYLPAGLNPSGIAITCKDVGLPAASALRPTHLNNYFRLATTDDLQGPAAADYASKTLHLIHVGVVSDHEAYGEALADAFTVRFQKLGGSVLGRLDLNASSNQDATGWLKTMKAAGAQAIYFGGATSGRGCAIRAEMQGIFAPGMATPFLGGDGIADDPACVDQAGPNVAGMFATVPVTDAGSQASASGVISAFKSAYSSAEDYGPYTVAAYDAAGILYAALDRAIRAAGGQLPPRSNVISQLTVTSGFAGATGTFGFDPAGDSTRRVISVYEPVVADPKQPWRFVEAFDYSTALPY